MTTPHAISLVDFDGDCLTDLFVTAKDSSGNNYYEIYLRREKAESIDLANIPGY